MNGNAYAGDELVTVDIIPGSDVVAGDELEAEQPLLEVAPPAPDAPAPDADAAGGAPPPPPLTTGLQTIESWRDQIGTPLWLFAGLKLGKGWAIGQEVTRKTYEEAAEWAASVACR